MIAAAAAAMVTLLAPAHGHATVVGSDLGQSTIVTSAIAIGCSPEGANCAKAVGVTFADRPNVVYPATVRTVTKIGLRAAVALLAVDRGEIAAARVTTRAVQGDVLTLLPDCRPSARSESRTYVASIGEDGAWIRAGLRAARDQAGCPLVDSDGNIVAVVDGSDDPLYPDPGFVAISSAVTAESGQSLHGRRFDDGWWSAPLDAALAKARTLTPDREMPDQFARHDSWFRAMPWWCRAADLGAVEAMVWCGRGYATGDGAPRDVARALKLFASAEQRGSADAKVAGAEVERDYGERLRRRAASFSAAATGEPVAQLEVALAFREGVGAPQDRAQAAVWFDRCAKQLSICAHYLGQAYLEGLGVPANEKRGVELVEWAATHCESTAPELRHDYFYLSKCSDAYVTLGNYYSNQYRQSYNSATARRYYELAGSNSSFARDEAKKLASTAPALPDTAASNKPIEERIADVNRYFQNHQSSTFHATNSAAYRQLAATNDRRALYAAGMFFRNASVFGGGEVGDDETAFRYLKSAADAGDYRAAHEVSIMYLAGAGVAKSSQESERMGVVSVELARKAAAAKDAEAYDFLGSSYMYGRSNYTAVSVDCHEAIKWFLLAAEKPNRVASLNLGILYTAQGNFGATYPDSVKCKEPRAGERWFRAAIALGDTNAMVILATLLRNGGLGRIDTAEAQHLLQTAADNGNFEAQSLLLKR